MKIHIPINPTAKARARTVSRDNKTWSYTPSDTQEAEADIHLIVSTELNRKGISFKPREPLEVIVTFFVPEPKRSKYDYPVMRPDLSNYIKCLEDGLAGIIPDDAQIVRVVAEKKYCEGQGYIELEVREIR